MVSLRRASGLLCIALAGLLTGCIAATPDEPEEAGADGPEPTGGRNDPLNPGSVADAASSTCVTSSVLKLSQQIIEEGNCISPGAYAEVPKLSNLTFNPNVFPYLEAPARDALVAALKAHPERAMTVTSMLRTVAQQYLLYRWYQTGRCGIGLAAKPGNSNHETGLALDIGEPSSWKSTMAANGFHWLGSNDPPHFDYQGAGAKSYKGIDVQAFQRLWTRNHPEDPITDDGSWGPKTEARMKLAPAAGFAKGASCGAPEEPLGGDPTACAHATCTEGAALDAACDPCATKICAGDGYCCTTAWDATCVGEVATACGTSCNAAGPACGAFEGQSSYTCSGDGVGRGKCDSGALTYESCARGCLISSGDDVCMGTTTTWSCDGTWGTEKAQNGDYYGTAFGCWTDADGDPQSDPGDNCIPSCLAEAKSSGLCAGMTGPACERKAAWFAADAGRFGCMARLRVTNPASGKSAVVVALDKGPSCYVEQGVSHAVIDLSYPAENYLFGGPTGADERALVHVVEVDAATPLGPQ